MHNPEREEIEARTRALCAQGDLEGAATLALKGYGSEVYGFLVTMNADEADASDIFAETCEALWRGLPTFEWRSSVRTWIYAVARNIMLTRARTAGRRRKRGVRVGASALAEVAHAVRTETLAYLRTEQRTRLQRLRDELPAEDRMLLVLRIDRKMAWNDLARILSEHEGAAPLSDEDVVKVGARLRKRFQVVKDRLRERAKAEGLIE